MAKITKEDLGNEEVLIDKLNQNHQNYLALFEELNTSLREEGSCMAKVFTQIQPILEYLREYEYWFDHPKIPDCKIKEGPILGYDSKRELLFYYDIEQRGFFVRDLDRQSNRKCSVQDFVHLCDMNQAIAGIEHVFQLQEKRIQKLKREIKKSKERLQKLQKLI